MAATWVGEGEDRGDDPDTLAELLDKIFRRGQDR